MIGNRVSISEEKTAPEMSDDTLPASPAMASKRMKAYPAMPMAQPIQALQAPPSPAQAKASMAAVPHESLLNIMRPIGFPVAFQDERQLDVRNGTVRPQSMYLPTTGDLCNCEPKHAHVHIVDTSY